MEEIKGFLTWVSIGAAGAIIKAGMAPILIMALASGILNQLGKRLADPFADYIQERMKDGRVKVFIIKWLRKKQKPKP